jgi:hypothetical protein
MKTNELRIDNYIKLNSKVIKVTGVNLCQIDADELLDFTMEDYFEPIPLTEAWLLKFGFGKSDEHELCHNTNESFYFFYDTHLKRLEIDCGENGEIIELKHIDSVHHLQNLYYTLTGKELELIEPLN